MSIAHSGTMDAWNGMELSDGSLSMSLQGDAYPVMLPPPPPPGMANRQSAMTKSEPVPAFSSFSPSSESSPLASAGKHRREAKTTLSNLAGVHDCDSVEARLQEGKQIRRNRPRLVFRPMHAIVAMMLLVAALCASLTMLIRQASNYSMMASVTETSAAATENQDATSMNGSQTDSAASDDSSSDAAMSDGSSPPVSSDAISSDGAAITQPSPINLNTASLAELDSIKGIGPVIAQRIIDHRAQIRRFVSVEQLLDVKGIGEKTLDKMRAQVTVQ